MQFHFIGICGTAMGSVAAALRDLGHTVTGSDANPYPPMSTFLESKGIEIVEGYRPENLPENADATIVIGNAISRGNEEMETALDQRRPYTSLPEVLKDHFLRGGRNLVVSGTHGKTTTSSMLAWVLKSANVDPSWMIGGIPENLGKGCHLSGETFTVLEGDEYDTAFFDKRSKFVHYLPEVVVVNNVEFDHADIFDDLDAIKLSFRRMLNIVPRNGAIFINGDCANSVDVAEGAPAPVISVGFGEHCAIKIEGLDLQPGVSSFQLQGHRYAIPHEGEFNVRNAAMAACAAAFIGVPGEEIAKALDGFQGVARRQQLRGEVNGIRVIDDFGHHPTAITGTVKGIRQRFPGCRVWALFEPRSNTSRRSIHQAALVDALAEADCAAVAAVDRPEQLSDEERLDVEKVVAELNTRGTTAYQEADADAIVAKVAPEAKEGDVFIVFSNGGFGGIHDKLLDALGN